MDPDKVVNGIGWENLDAESEIVACSQAVERFLHLPRLKGQLGRAYLKSGDLRAAGKWLRVASEMGYVGAQEYLAIMYMNEGVDGRRDKSTALKWIMIASSGGSKFAPQFLRDWSSGFSSEELARVKHMADQWSEKSRSEVRYLFE